MNRLSPVLLTTVAAMGALIALFACQEDATPRAKQSKEWLDKFYTRYTIRGEWGYFGSEAKDKNVLLEINVPERQAQDLIKMSTDDRTKFIARNACAPRSEEVWSMLDADGDIIVHARLNGNVFASVNCRNNL